MVYGVANPWPYSRHLGPVPRLDQHGAVVSAGLEDWRDAQAPPALALLSSCGGISSMLLGLPQSKVDQLQSTH